MYSPFLVSVSFWAVSSFFFFVFFLGGGGGGFEVFVTISRIVSLGHLCVLQ